jgi:hypothetical protein
LERFMRVLAVLHSLFLAFCASLLCCFCFG